MNVLLNVNGYSNEIKHAKIYNPTKMGKEYEEFTEKEIQVS